MSVRAETGWEWGMTRQHPCAHAAASYHAPYHPFNMHRVAHLPCQHPCLSTPGASFSGWLMKNGCAKMVAQ